MDRKRIDEISETLMKVVVENSTKKLILDFGQLELIASEAFGALVLMQLRFEKVDCELFLYRLNPTIREVLVNTRLDDVFKVIPDHGDSGIVDFM